MLPDRDEEIMQMGETQAHSANPATGGSEVTEIQLSGKTAEAQIQMEYEEGHHTALSGLDFSVTTGTSATE